MTSLWLSLCLSADLARAQFVPVPPPPPAPVPVAPPVVVPAPSPVVAVKVFTLPEFAATFRPAPGKYEVTFLHPVSRRPVTLCFELPGDCPCKVVARKRSLTFDYGRKQITLTFRLGGKADVRYR